MKRKPYERTMLVHGFPRHSHVLVQVFYHSGSRDPGIGAMPRGYYLCVRPISKANGIPTYDMDLMSKVFLFGAKSRRFCLGEFRQAIQIGERLVPEKVDFLRKTDHYRHAGKLAA